MRRQGRKIRLYPALTLIETVLSLTIMAIIFAVLLPQLRMIQNSWDSNASSAESLQNGRVLIDHLNRNLSKAVRITDVSDSVETDGYIEFEDNASSTLRYDIAGNNYVEFGTVGSLNDLAGPVSQLLFTCYDGNDMGTPITDVDDIRLVNVEAILTNPTRDLTVKTFAYLRTGPLPNVIVDPNLILWLMLDESSGSTAVDTSGYGNHGTLENMDPTTDWVAGQIDNALDFDGDNDTVVVSHDESISLVDKITVAGWFWANPGSLDGYDLAFVKGTSDNNCSFWFGTLDDEISFGFYNGAGQYFETSGQNLQTELWYHMAATFDNATDEVYVYLNGLEVGSWSTSQVRVANTEDLHIGTNQYDENWDGKLDDLRIYDYAMSEAEVGGLYYISGPAYQQFTEAVLDSDGTSLTISTPGGAVEDSLLIAAMATDGDTTASLAPPPGEGWTEVFLNDQSGQVTIGVWWKLADASESASHGFSWSGSQQAYGWMMRFEGHDPDDPVDVYSADGETSASPSSPPVTTTLDNCLILRLGAFDDKDITLDDPGLSGHTAITMDASQSSGVSYEEFTEAKAGSDTTSLTISTPAGTVAGDLLIAAVATDGDNLDSLAAPAGEGWTARGVADKGGKVTLGIWSKLADASESPSHEFTWDDNEQAYGWMMRFTGHDPSGPIGQTAMLEDKSETPVCPSVDTVAANSMILRIGGFDDDDINLDDPGLSGHTPITMDESSSVSDTCSGGAGCVLQASPGASGTSEFVLTKSKDYVCFTIAIEADLGGGGGSVSGGAGYVTQASAGSSGSSNFSLTASEEARTVTIAIAPVP